VRCRSRRDAYSAANGTIEIGVEAMTLAALSVFDQHAREK
jgi:hypothetical protein